MNFTNVFILYRIFFIVRVKFGLYDMYLYRILPEAKRYLLIWMMSLLSMGMGRSDGMATEEIGEFNRPCESFSGESSNIVKLEFNNS